GSRRGTGVGRTVPRRWVASPDRLAASGQVPSGAQPLRDGRIRFTASAVENSVKIARPSHRAFMPMNGDAATDPPAPAATPPIGLLYMVTTSLLRAWRPARTRALELPGERRRRPFRRRGGRRWPSGPGRGAAR